MKDAKMVRRSFPITDRGPLTTLRIQGCENEPKPPLGKYNTIHLFTDTGALLQVSKNFRLACCDDSADVISDNCSHWTGEPVNLAAAIIYHT